MQKKLDLIVIGAGAAGLACAIEAKRRKLDFVVIEKDCVISAIFHFPTNMTFFTTANLLEIGGIPLVSSEEKPKRADALKYYRRVVDHYELPIRDYEKVTQVTGWEPDFSLQTVDRFGLEHQFKTRRLIVATGYYHNPNMMNIPGEDRPHVSHYYTEPHRYFGKKVAVIGGKNSAIEAALELYRNSVDVTLIHRGSELLKHIKYWILPDILNRIKRKEISVFLSTSVEEIGERDIVLQTPQGRRILESDFVLAMTGYHPDGAFLKSMGIKLDPKTMVPELNQQTLESNVPGLFIAGAIVSGRMTNKIFIENGRFHGKQIFEHW